MEKLRRQRSNYEQFKVFKHFKYKLLLENIQVLSTLKNLKCILVLKDGLRFIFQKIIFEIFNFLIIIIGSCLNLFVKKANINLFQGLQNIYIVYKSNIFLSLPRY